MIFHAYRRCRQARTKLARWQRHLFTLVDQLGAGRVHQGEAEFRNLKCGRASVAGLEKNMDEGQVIMAGHDRGPRIALPVRTQTGAAQSGNIHDLAPLTIPDILRWADSHHDRHGTWPKRTSGKIPEPPDESWLRVDEARLASGFPSPRSD